MGKKMTRAGMELRRAIRAEIDAIPGIDHLDVRKKFQVGEPIVESAMTKSLAEWDALIGATPQDQQSSPAPAETTTSRSGDGVVPMLMPGLEQGVVKFTRKPAKMGTDFIFWVPRVYIKNGLVDPACEYEVFLRKTQKG
jgi:hypothetical protein